MRLICTLFIVFVLFSCSAPEPGDGYDVVVLNGRVMDPETDFDEVRNVGIKDGIIVTISENELEGKRVINASGHVVAPGFIDTHNHGNGNLWGMKGALRDGVTTPMDLEMGCANIEEWYDVREGKWPCNYGAAVSHEFHRMKILDGLELDGPTDGEDFARLRGASYEENDTADWAVTRATSPST